MVLVGVVAVGMLVPESRDPRPGQIDVIGVLLSVVGLVALTYGIIDGGEHGFGRPLVWVSIIGGLAVLAAFVLYERRIEFPSLDVRLFKVPRFAAPVAMVGLIFFAAMGVMFFSSFYLQLVRGYSPLQTGLLFLPFAAAQLIFAPRSAAMVKRYGAKAVSRGRPGPDRPRRSPRSSSSGRTRRSGSSLVLVLRPGRRDGQHHRRRPPSRSCPRCPGRRPASARRSATPSGRSAARSASRCSARCSPGSTGTRSRSSTGALPGPARDAANESISGAYGVAAQLGPAGQGVIGAANDAFVSAMHWAAGLSAVVVAIGILVALRWMPGHAATHVARPAGARRRCAGTGTGVISRKQ